MTRRFRGSEPGSETGQQPLSVGGQQFTWHNLSSSWCQDFRNRYAARGRLLERIYPEQGQPRAVSTDMYDAAGLLTGKATTYYSPSDPASTGRGRFTYTTC